ncbi:hypothetical protein [Sphingomonas sp.]|uniref:hypothetical protein n=1 Tax=Sphingomonas sp. TaxID=28214 RepID=UPI003CC6B0ED
MKFNKMLPAEVREGDDPEMIAAIDRLIREGITARRPHNNRHQLKVGPTLSYYPTTRRIVTDGEPAWKETGIDAVIAIMLDRGLL